VSSVYILDVYGLFSHQRHLAVTDSDHKLKPCLVSDPNKMVETAKSKKFSKKILQKNLLK